MKSNELGTGFGRLFLYQTPSKNYQVEEVAIPLITKLKRNFNKLGDTNERTKNRQNPNCR